MSYKFNTAEPAGTGVRRMAREQIDKALSEVADAELGPDETAHQIRKRCKKLRALLRLARGDLDNDSRVYHQENSCFRDAAGQLSGIRDAAAEIETYDRLIGNFSKQANQQRLKKVRDVLVERRLKILEDDRAVDEKFQQVAETLRQARERIAEWPVGEKFDALAPGLKKTYRRGRRAMKDAAKSPDTENFHEWRKRVKYHRYHLRVLRPVWDEVLDAWVNELHVLSDLLGEDHDLAVFGKTLNEERAEFDSDRDLQALLGLTNQRRAGLQAKAFELGQKVFAEEPKPFVRRTATYWETSVSSAENDSGRSEDHIEVSMQQEKTL